MKWILNLKYKNMKINFLTHYDIGINKSSLLLSLFMVILLTSSCNFKDSMKGKIPSITGTGKDAVILTPNEYNAVAVMNGTTTFSNYGAIVGALEDSKCLKQYGELTFQAGIVLYIPFENGVISGHGQVWNITDSDHNLEISFYDESILLYSYNLILSSQTCNHLCPADIYSSAKGANKVVVRGLSYTELIQPIPAPDGSYRQIRNADTHKSSNDFFNASYEGSSSEDESIWVEFYDNGECRIDEDNLTEYYTCKGRYEVSDDGRIFLNWNDGQSDTIYINGETFQLHYFTLRRTK